MLGESLCSMPHFFSLKNLPLHKMSRDPHPSSIRCSVALSSALPRAPARTRAWPLRACNGVA